MLFHIWSTFLRKLFGKHPLFAKLFRTSPERHPNKTPSFFQKRCQLISKGVKTNQKLSNPVKTSQIRFIKQREEQEKSGLHVRN